MILFVGDKPSKRTDPDVPFKGAACEFRLKQWFGSLEIEEPTLVNSSDTVKFTVLVGKCYYSEYPIIALGNNASKALKSVPHFKLPHPSGRNRQINDSEFIAKKLAECKRYIEGFKCTLK